MLFPASCLAAATAVLCLNLVSGFFDHALRRMQSEYSPLHQRDRSNTFDDVISPSRSNGRGSLYGRDMVTAESDMMLTPEQSRRLYQGVQGRSAGRKTVGRPWTEGRVPYEIQPGHFTKDEENWILRGMRNWESLTCVRFVPALANDTNKVIIKKIKGCNAGLGMQGRTQYCSLDNGCFFRGTVEHELGHTLGLIHEHQRPNRDDYVKINYFAAKSRGLFQLTKYAEGSEDKYGLPYDYHSIMHYNKRAYAEWSKQTIYPKLVSKTDVIGMNLKPSFYDTKLVNLMYQCKDRCKNPPYCREPCFVNEKCQCFCQKDAPKEVCQDLNADCQSRAEEGYCDVDVGYMLHYCRKSCGVCQSTGSVPQITCVDWNVGCSQEHCNDADSANKCLKTCKLCPDYSKEPPCADNLGDCGSRAESGECDKNPEVMLQQCRRSCDFCPGHRRPQRVCEDKDTICEYLKENGGCERFPAKMSQYCQRSCNNCDNKIILPANCFDYSPYCFEYAWQGQCVRYSRGCRKSCNYCQLQRLG